MKSRDSNTDHNDQLLEWILDRIFVLPMGHEEVSALLKEEFLKKYKTQLKQIDSADVPNFVEQLTNLVNIFLLGTWQDNDIISGIRQIYEKAIETELRKIPKTGTGAISKSDANKRAYANQPITTPVKSFVEKEYNKLNSSPKVENYNITLLSALGRIRLDDNSQAKAIFEKELELVFADLFQKDKLIAELNNYEQDVTKKQDFDSRFDTMISSLGNKPFFIINTPMHVPVDERTLADSSDEELDGEYSLDDFKVPPYYVKFNENAERGQLLKHNLQRMQSSPSSSISLYANPFLEKMKFEGWAEEFTGNAFAVIGLNRSRSLSTSRNQALHDEFNRVIKSDLPHEVMGFFWDRIWYKGKYPTEKVTYAEVRKFYKQFKRVNLDRAKAFRKENENNGHTPYQDIRERLRQSFEAADIVRRVREKSPNAHVYFSMLDSDTKHFNGIYTEYENFVIGQSNPPHVMSTGYEFSDDPKDHDNLPEDLISKLANLNLASKIDRAVRIETAKLIPTGVYYPEPNTCILIPGSNKILTAKFLDYSKNKGDEESAVMLREVMKNGGTSFYFIEGRPLITALPLRAFTRARGGEFKFSEVFTKGESYITEDLINLADITQSHFYFDIWATNLEKNNPNPVEKRQEKHGILCDLFNYFKATILEGKESFKSGSKEVTKDSVCKNLLKYSSEEEAVNLWNAGLSAMKKVQFILNNRKEYLQHPAYKPFAKGRYASAVTAARRDDVQVAKLESQMQDLDINDIGPSKLEGYTFQNFAGDGNSFYYAVVEQLKKAAPNLLANTAGIPAHHFIRMHVQKEKFKDKEWADESHFDSFVQNFPVALAIIDTRHPAKGFNTRYFYDQRMVHVFPLHLVTLPQNMPVVKLATTGDRFLSVITTPKDHAVTLPPQVGFAARVSAERQQTVEQGIGK